MLYAFWGKERGGVSQSYSCSTCFNLTNKSFVRNSDFVDNVNISRALGHDYEKCSRKREQGNTFKNHLKNRRKQCYMAISK